MEELLKQIDEILKEESSEKINRAMRLFVKVDITYKRIVLHTTAFKGELNARNLRSHFDTLDLLGSLDDLIFDMEDDLENS